MDRRATKAGQLARKGFAEPHQALAVIEPWFAEHGEEAARALLAPVIASADPDLALAALAHLADEHPDVFGAVRADPDRWRRLALVCGASAALGRHVCVHPDATEALAGPLEPADADALRGTLLTAVGADPDAPVPLAEAGRADDLRLAYRRALVRIAARDLDAEDPLETMPSVARELADLADATVEAALALARAETPGHEQVRLAVLAMGKTGARELNYVSDVDVIHVAEPALDAAGEPVVSSGEALALATKLAAGVARICSAHTGAGTIWQVDANLRPEGKNGPLVRSLASMATYYEKWAKNWEFQALLKARPMAGDRALGQEFVGLVAPHVWAVADDPAFVGESQAMRRRVIALIPAREADVEIKLGAGGLRDTEFTVQLLQLVHGRADDRLRVRGTFEGLEALVACGYVGREDGEQLSRAYRLQRVLEHRIQLFWLRRTHLMPADDPAALRRLARSTRHPDAAALLAAWRQSTRQVLRLHQRMFYSPLLEAVARIPSAAVRLTSESAQTRLRALGFNDTAAALRHIEALSTGFSRRAEIQRQLLPAMLGWFASGPNPDHGLLAFRQVSEELGDTAWYLRALRDEGAMAENLARVLATSRFAVDLLLRAPQTVQMLSGGSEPPRQFADILASMEAVARRHENPVDAIAAIRAVRREELLRVAMARILQTADLAAVGDALSAIMSATLDAALGVAARDIENPPRLALIAMGRWGGREVSYASDADAMVVVADSEDDEALAKANRIITRLRDWLRKPGADPALELDLDLRPEGKGGPMVRTLASYRAYYERWSSTWEAQALVRAAHGAGDRELSRALLGAIDVVRYPEAGLARRQVTEIRKLKARMENERLPRGADPRRHVKLGPGGLSDVEWTIQLLQLEYAHAEPGLRTTRSMAALEVLEATGHLSQADAADLRTAWTLASRIRNAAMLLRGRASDTIPTDARELAALADLLGYPPGEVSTFTDDWARAARHARAVMDRVFWGLR
ncbi:bifunctional [glutamine synthetase] adenylyltransferase/[glutamine synthetase]-adenylyl-L-tyrosine phosphorylase [Propioniciclava soli]|uniref:Bifunctional [glutamine synthetase] adenylyltransferase/[glutamine synthetase]-adenylyl-L-tyrosine phosphorylase n=1 Tax=Propioniciclava soli TaxID=2775081 RepID=A0ABZ3C549_9ACTN